MLDKELENKVKDYIKRAVEHGYSENDIRVSLNEKGYPREAVNYLLNKYVVKHHEGNNPLMYASIFIVLIIAVIIGFFIFMPAKECEDQKCFVEIANKCGSAELSQLEDGSLFEYSTEDCVLIKKAGKISASEPVEIRNLLEGKEMECKYSKGLFNKDWLNTLSKGIEGCDGELKKGMEVILASI